MEGKSEKGCFNLAVDIQIWGDQCDRKTRSTKAQIKQ